MIGRTISLNTIQLAAPCQLILHGKHYLLLYERTDFLSWYSEVHWFRDRVEQIAELFKGVKAFFTAL